MVIHLNFEYHEARECRSDNQWGHANNLVYDALGYVFTFCYYACYLFVIESSSNFLMLCIRTLDLLRFYRVLNSQNQHTVMITLRFKIMEMSHYYRFIGRASILEMGFLPFHWIESNSISKIANIHLEGYFISIEFLVGSMMKIEPPKDFLTHTN